MEVSTDQTAESTEKSEASRCDSIVDKGLRRSFWERQTGLYLLDKAVSQDRLYKQAKLVRSLVSRLQNGTLGVSVDEDRSVDEEETQFHVGDTNIHLHGASDKELAASPIDVIPTSGEQSRRPSMLLPIAAFSAIAAGQAFAFWLFNGSGQDKDTWSVVVPLEEEGKNVVVRDSGE